MKDFTVRIQSKINKIRHSPGPVQSKSSPMLISDVNIVEWLVSIPAVQLFLGSALTISFGLACGGYTFDRRAFNVLFQKV